jgi:hypothetical protein
VTLTPLVAQARGSRLAERAARFIIDHGIRRGRSEVIRRGVAMVPYWENATALEPPVFCRRHASSGNWLELIPDPCTDDD